MTGDGFLAFGDDIFQNIVALLHGIAGESEVSKEAIGVGFDLTVEHFEGEASDGVDVGFGPGAGHRVSGWWLSAVQDGPLNDR